MTVVIYKPSEMPEQEWHDECCFWCPPDSVVKTLFLHDSNNYCISCNLIKGKPSSILPYVPDAFCSCTHQQLTLGDFE